VMVVCICLYGIYRKKKMITFFSLSLVVLIIACRKDDFFETIEKIPVSEESYTLDHLEPGLIYYWKIAAYNNWDIKTESRVQSFMTGL
jgi:hypothetical protein